MKPIKILYDQTAQSLSVWFDDPKKEVLVEETSEEIMVSKDKHGHTIGLEILNYNVPVKSRAMKFLPIETAVV